MKSEKYLKDENQKIVVIFVAWCIALYLSFSANAELSMIAIQARFEGLRLKDGIAMVLMPVLVLVLSGIIPSSMKEIIVFWRIKHALPGCRAFSKLAPRDDRIDMTVLRQKLGTLPTDPTEQNATWYKLLKQYSGITTVERAHKYFLLSRDLSTIALLFAVFGCLGLVVTASSPSIIAEYAIVFGIHYVALALVARNNGNRLVCNVLAEFAANGR